MWLRASWLHRRLVPIHVKSGSITGTNVPNRAGELIVDGQEQAPADSVSAHGGRCSTRLGRSRGWPALIKAANWLTHLEYEWESPVWRHWIRFFTDHFRFIRHDERGCGMTDWNVGDLSFDRWVEDLEAVVAAAGPREPFALLGISQGAATCLAYAVRHPERVSQLVLYGGYARGTFRRGDPDKERLY